MFLPPGTQRNVYLGRKIRRAEFIHEKSGAENVNYAVESMTLNYPSLGEKREPCGEPGVKFRRCNAILD